MLRFQLVTSGKAIHSGKMLPLGEVDFEGPTERNHRGILITGANTHGLAVLERRGIPVDYSNCRALLLLDCRLNSVIKTSCDGAGGGN